MHWNVALAKQRLSELIREAAIEPQVIYNRDSPVAVVIAAEELTEYNAWKRGRARQTTLAEEFDRLRDLAGGHDDPLPAPDRLAVMRSNAFDPAVDDGAENNRVAAVDATR